MNKRPGATRSGLSITTGGMDFMTKQNNDVVIIQLDRPRELRYGHKALKTLTALTGKTLEDLENPTFNVEDIEKIIYCGLLSDARKNNETLRLEDMEDLLDQAPSYQHIIEKMQEAFAAAFGPVAEGNGRGENQNHGTGMKA